MWDELATFCTRVNQEFQRKVSRYNVDGSYWQGKLADSPLATALALIVLRINGDPNDLRRCIQAVSWLNHVQREDGGFGDTPDDLSNLATTLITWSALKPCKSIYRLPLPEQACAIQEKVEKWLTRQLPSLSMDDILQALQKSYQQDLTFSVPIACICALGLEEEHPDSWDRIPSLFYEWALLPHSWYRWVRMGVVSYALPALLAIGYLLATKQKITKIRRWFRNRLRFFVLHQLEELQPSSGGYLEAIPLTAFVTIALLLCGYRDHPVVKRGLKFIHEQYRPYGAWPIEANLSCWLTSLLSEALWESQELGMITLDLNWDKIMSWICAQQINIQHPFTHADPGGWGWTHLPGSVPDTDDTSAAIISLSKLQKWYPYVRVHVLRGCAWLLQIQNPDGGFPTFCRGWGHLPFDRSCPALTAHAIHALVCGWEWFPNSIRKRVQRSVLAGLRYLADQQRSDGYWQGLWFGSQYTQDASNPVYTTGTILLHIRQLRFVPWPYLPSLIQRAEQFLLASQNEDGSWGANHGCIPSLEETCAALSGIANPEQINRISETVFQRGLKWVAENSCRSASNIGLYFSLLWYSEELYPIYWGIKATNQLYYCFRKLSPRYQEKELS